MASDAPAPVTVAVDNSEAALQLVDNVCKNIPKDKLLDVVHVVPMLHPGLATAVAGSIDFVTVDIGEEVNEKEELASARFLRDAVRPRLEKAGFTVKTTLLRTSGDGSSDIGDAICRRAATVGASLLVLSKSSKSALAKVFVGSVARYTLDHSSLPVLVCPTSTGSK